MTFFLPRKKYFLKKNDSSHARFSDFFQNHVLREFIHKKSNENESKQNKFEYFYHEYGSKNNVMMDKLG